MRHLIALLFASISLCFTSSFYGQNDYSMSFDGVDDTITLLSNPSWSLFSDFTVQLWWLKDIASTNNACWTIGDSYSGGLELYVGSGGDVTKVYADGNVRIAADYNPPNGEWHHYAVVRESGIIKLFIDGVQDPTAWESNLIFNGDLVLGYEVYNNPADPSEMWCHGLVDNFKISNVALSASEIQNYIQCSSNEQEGSLLVNWNFEEGSGTSAADQTSNGNDGTINGATWSTDVPEQSCPSDCTDSVACNYNPDATEDDGSCDYSCCPGPGCCSEGMYWDWDLQECYNTTPTDTNLDGCTDLNDLMDILASYGDCAVAEFTCGDQIEHEGYSYSTVQIGEQCWFSENCRYLPSVSYSSEGNTTYPYYYVYGYEGTEVSAAEVIDNYETYGVLYNWPAVMTSGICPSGWHIPTDGEWQTMEMSLGMSASEASSYGWRGSPVGDYMKSTSGWNSGSGGNGSNSSGFNGLPGGYRESGGFYHSGSNGLWWSASESGSGSWRRELDSNSNGVYRDDGNRYTGYSARCVIDYTDECGVVNGDNSTCLDECGVPNGDNSTCFTSCGDPISHEGYDYSTVLIGDQCWFSENCRYLPEVSPSSVGSETEPYYYVYDYQGTDVEAAKSTENYETYGVLYNWPAAITEGLCPSGWYVPTDEEFTQLTDFIGGESVAGDAMKSTSGWSNNGNGSNSSGFEGLPGGYNWSNGLIDIGYNATWWSSSASNSSEAWQRRLYGDVDNVNRFSDHRHNGFSVRCIKD